MPGDQREQAAALGDVAFAALLGDSPEHRYHPSTLWSWLTAGQLDFGLRIVVDPLSVFMMLVVSGVGMLIVLYSIGYMEHDERRRRFFGYLNLFVAAMLTLVLSADYVGVFLGWEGVGLASYLLIGFWHKRPEAVAAAKKAFVMNAIGDATFALARVARDGASVGSLRASRASLDETLDRLDERKDFNREVRERSQQTPVELTSVLDDLDAVHEDLGEEEGEHPDREHRQRHPGARRDELQPPEWKPEIDREARQGTEENGLAK